ncbi:MULTISPECIES: RidA family protein [unclassified Spirosoma]|uniref:RidA family protein n=1 Tax=unclassified Spirosoma TaxID=2621999 RepID=UPI000A54A0AB|nr:MULTISPECIES: RidA family protein [unclassified Spirosoma]MBN8821913.1 RidA family protein [Spirosoma sp.]
MKKVIYTLAVSGLTLLLSATLPANIAKLTEGMADVPGQQTPSYPFSRAMRAGDFVYISGQIGVKADGKLADGFDAQSRQTMDNIVAALKEQGLTTADVVKCTVMIGDMAKWPEFNTIYRSYFKEGQFPARSAFGANGLALGAALEVDCIAYAPLKGKAK